MRRLESLFEGAGLIGEAVGVAVIVLGADFASVLALARLRTLGPSKTYAAYRVGLAGSIFLGPELLVAGDIIRTVVVAADARKHRLGFWLPKPSRCNSSLWARSCFWRCGVHQLTRETVDWGSGTPPRRHIVSSGP